MRRLLTLKDKLGFSCKSIAVGTLLLTSYLLPLTAHAQGVHFSQYYNAPLLLNPANTALMPDDDYHAGFNYRKQWASIPAPFQTISAYAHLQAFRNQNESNWLGVGAAVFSDKAGNGDLSLTRIEGFVAYHVQLGLNAMVSAGASVANVQRSVVPSQLTYDMQWDGFQFNRAMPANEGGNTAKASYADIGAGVNLAYFPNEDVYIKVGLGMSHVNSPVESFYNQKNKISPRPNANIDAVFKLNPTFILNPSLYYTTQRGAAQLMYGTLTQFNVTPENSNTTTALIFGAFHRWNESVVGAVGLDIENLRIMSSYDFTISSLGSVNKGRGAMEFGVTYRGLYGDGSRGRRSYGCPRF